MASVVVYGEGEDGESGEGENVQEHEHDDVDVDLDMHRKKPHVHHRKRKKSVRECDGSYVPPYKKNRFRRQVSVLPSKFLLGGNIRDPLNLASLADAKVNAEVNRATPTSSPLSVPSNNNQNLNKNQGQIPVFIPKNPVDPLGLGASTDKEEDIIVGVRTRGKKKHRRGPKGRRRTDSECSVGTDTVGEEEEENVEVRANMVTMRQDKGAGEKIKRKSIGKEGTGESEDGGKKKEEKGESFGENKKEVTVRCMVKDKKGEDPVQGSQVKPAVVAVEKGGGSKIEEAVVKTSGDSKSDAKPGNEVTKDSKIETTREVKEKAANADSKATPNPSPKTNGEEQPPRSGSGSYPCKSSEYVPLSSSYAPSPYIFDTMNPEDGFEVKPFESPSLTNYYCNAGTPSHLMEPFSPPPRPEIPHFQKRMQMMSNVPHRPPEISLQRAVFQKPFYRRRFRHKSDPIVSPVIPQPGCSKKRNHHHHHNHRHNKKNDKQGNSLNTSNTSTNSTHSSASKKGTTAKTNKPSQGSQSEIRNFRSKDEIYQFGNYKQYYGYRTLDGDDNRLWVMKKEWFRDKDVLDIGCNIGHVTLSIARDFEARRVHGIDIDNNLITTARKNIKHYMIRDPNDKNVVFPHSLPMIYGAIQPPSGVGLTTPQQFPFNVMFSQENYVLSNDTQLESVKPEYDVIICLSVTKWIHLNFGDDGLKRFFRRMYRHLRKGGKLILEPQEWSSYYRKRKLTAKISENYKKISFLPDHFQEFLVNEVGFTFTQRLGTPHHSKGFQRPILIFSKDSKESSPVTEQNTSAAPAIVVTDMSAMD